MRRRGSALMPMVEPEIEGAPWASQAEADAPLYLRQIEHLFERSRFYREKLAAAGFETPGAVGGLGTIAALPFTEKDELRASRSPEEPIGTHRTATRDEIERIYSTSGTTGTPSYIPLTAADLDVWVRTSARSYAASGIVVGRAHRFDLQRRPVRRRRRARAFDRLGPLPYPGRIGEHRAADDGGRSAEADRRGPHAVLRAASGRMGARARHRSAEAPA